MYIYYLLTCVGTIYLLSTHMAGHYIGERLLSSLIIHKLYRRLVAVIFSPQVRTGQQRSASTRVCKSCHGPEFVMHWWIIMTVSLHPGQGTAEAEGSCTADVAMTLVTQVTRQIGWHILHLSRRYRNVVFDITDYRGSELWRSEAGTREIFNVIWQLLNRTPGRWAREPF